MMGHVGNKIWQNYQFILIVSSLKNSNVAVFWVAPEPKFGKNIDSIDLSVDQTRGNAAVFWRASASQFGEGAIAGKSFNWKKKGHCHHCLGSARPKKSCFKTRRSQTRLHSL